MRSFFFIVIHINYSFKITIVHTTVVLCTNNKKNNHEKEGKKKRKKNVWSN